MAHRASNRLRRLEEQSFPGLDRARRRGKRIRLAQEFIRGLCRLARLHTGISLASARRGRDVRHPLKRGFQVGDHIGHTLLTKRQIPVRHVRRFTHRRAAVVDDVVEIVDREFFKRDVGVNGRLRFQS